MIKTKWGWFLCHDYFNFGEQNTVSQRALTVSGLFSKISLASSLLQYSSIHSLSIFPFLLSSIKEFARRFLTKKSEACFWDKTKWKQTFCINNLVLCHQVMPENKIKLLTTLRAVFKSTYGTGKKDQAFLDFPKSTQKV